MSQTTSDQPVLDVSGTARTPASRLYAVELRKTADTRAGRWLLGAIVLITAAVLVIFLVNADAQDRTFETFAAITVAPQGFLLPVLGILLVTSEWSQRTAMVTFALEPSRARVVAAKLAAAVTFGIAAFAVAVVLAALATLVGGADDGFAGTTATILLLFLLLQVMTILQGLAFGLLLLNSPAAIVAYFVLPVAFTIVASIVPGLRDIAAWVDVSTAQQPLLAAGGGLSGEESAQLLTSSLIWIVLPLVAGVARIMRAEVK